jgi:hypothetical protein
VLLAHTALHLTHGDVFVLLHPEAYALLDPVVLKKSADATPLKSLGFAVYSIE